MGVKPRYQVIDGFVVPLTFVSEVFYSAMAYKPEKGEVVVSTYPKCGTTWTMQIVMCLLKNGKPCETAAEYFGSNLFLEMTGEEGVKIAPKPRIVKTHLPFDRITYSPEAKYIYVARHPRDAVVSFYHHTKFFPIYFFSDGTFDDYFDLFINDQLDFNGYFDNLLSWYNQRDKPNILFLTFESMKKDTRGTVLKIAEFLGDQYYEAATANDSKMLQDILHYSSLDYMRETINQFWRDTFGDKPPSEEYQNQNAVAKKYAQVMKEAHESGHFTIGEFIRKGNVGEGKITLSEDQKKRMDEYIERKTRDCPEVLDIWK